LHLHLHVFQHEQILKLLYELATALWFAEIKIQEQSVINYINLHTVSPSGWPYVRSIYQ